MMWCVRFIVYRLTKLLLIVREDSVPYLLSPFPLLSIQIQMNKISSAQERGSSVNFLRLPFVQNLDCC